MLSRCTTRPSPRGDAQGDRDGGAESAVLSRSVLELGSGSRRDRLQSLTRREQATTVIPGVWVTRGDSTEDLASVPTPDRRAV
jgi:hypothetical protein